MTITRAESPDQRQQVPASSCEKSNFSGAADTQQRTLNTATLTNRAPSFSDFDGFLDLVPDMMMDYASQPASYHQLYDLSNLTALDGSLTGDHWLESLDSDDCLSMSLYEHKDSKKLDASSTESSQDVDDVSQLNVTYVDNLEQVYRRICDASSALGISNDPYGWRVGEVGRWVTWAVQQQQHSLPPHQLQLSQLVEMDGTTLCMMSLEDFQRYSSHHGAALHDELELWKNFQHLVATSIEYSSTSLSIPPSIDRPMSRLTAVASDLTYADLDNLSQMASSSASTSSCFSVNLPTTVPFERHHVSPSSRRMCSSFLVGGVDPIFSQSLSTPSLFSNTSIKSTITKQSYDFIDDDDATGGVHSIIDQLNILNQHAKQQSASSAVTSSSVASSAVTSSGVYLTSYTCHRVKQGIHLWQFLKELLMQPNSYQNSIRWLDQCQGIFKIEDSALVARLWGERKKRPAMNYDKLSRSIRQYYKKGIIKKTSQSRRLVYQFCSQYLS